MKHIYNVQLELFKRGSKRDDELNGNFRDNFHGVCQDCHAAATPPQASSSRVQDCEGKSAAMTPALVRWFIDITLPALMYPINRYRRGTG